MNNFTPEQLAIIIRKAEEGFVEKEDGHWAPQRDNITDYYKALLRSVAPPATSDDDKKTNWLLIAAIVAGVLVAGGVILKVTKGGK